MSLILVPDSKLVQTFIPASHFGEIIRDSVDLLVIHTAECRQSSTSAEAVGAYFGMHSTGVSAHYSLDLNSIVQCVHEAFIAWAAGHEGNLRGIHFELAGFAKETDADWASDNNQSMLALLSPLLADVAARWNIPLVWVDATGLLAGQRGVTTHEEISKAWKQSNHHDPGNGCPIDSVIYNARLAA